MAWGGVVACVIIVSSQDLSFENLTLNQSIWRLEKFAAAGGGGGGLFAYSVTPGPGPDLELDNIMNHVFYQSFTWMEAEKCNTDDNVLDEKGYLYFQT